MGLMFLCASLVSKRGKDLVFYFPDSLGLKGSGCYLEEVPCVFRAIISKPHSLDPSCQLCHSPDV